MSRRRRALRRVILGLVVAIALHQAWLLASVVGLRWEDPASTSMMQARLEEDDTLQIDQRWRPLDELPAKGPGSDPRLRARSHSWASAGSWSCT
jgi:hypothetical protein